MTLGNEDEGDPGKGWQSQWRDERCGTSLAELGGGDTVPWRLGGDLRACTGSVSELAQHWTCIGCNMSDFLCTTIDWGCLQYVFRIYPSVGWTSRLLRPEQAAEIAGATNLGLARSHFRRLQEAGACRSPA